MTAPLDHAAFGDVLEPDYFEADTFDGLDADLIDMQRRIANAAVLLETVLLPVLLTFAGCLAAVCVVSQAAKLLG